ncbi:putative xyloglucan endotransglucosylase/hydrolase protein 16 [Hordeum vulgare]|nr:putative xyloglucan endotransglucosylase/hydrolase protein 16 [Hordeum vulgare]
MGQARAYLLASLAAFYLVALAIPQVTADMTDEVNLLWGNCKVQRDGAGRQTVAMSLDRWTTSGFSSKIKYLFGRIDMEIKLMPGNSAGTVTTFYMMSEGPWQFHDEIDLEFLGNSTGNPYTLHTNVFLVDNKLIRQIKNKMMNGSPYPNYQPMRVFSTIWNADDWATQGGRVKTDWTQAPFTAYFRNYKATSCSQGQNSNVCGQSSPNGLFNQQQDQMQQQQVKEVDAKYKVYDFCDDSKRRIGSSEDCQSQ